LLPLLLLHGEAAATVARVVEHKNGRVRGRLRVRGLCAGEESEGVKRAGQGEIASIQQGDGVYGGRARAEVGQGDCISFSCGGPDGPCLHPPGVWAPKAGWARARFGVGAARKKKGGGRAAPSSLSRPASALTFFVRALSVCEQCHPAGVCGRAGREPRSPHVRGKGTPRRKSEKEE